MMTICGRCGIEMWSIKLMGRRKEFCEDCQKAKHRERNAARYQAVRTGLVTAVAQYIMAGDAPKRQRCDAAINRGKVNRRCQCCYTLYHLDRLETPCPSCGAHLSDLPFPLQEESHVA